MKNGKLLIRLDIRKTRNSIFMIFWSGNNEARSESWTSINSDACTSSHKLPALRVLQNFSLLDVRGASRRSSQTSPTLLPEKFSENYRREEIEFLLFSLYVSAQKTRKRRMKRAKCIKLLRNEKSSKAHAIIEKFFFHFALHFPLFSSYHGRHSLFSIKSSWSWQTSTNGPKRGVRNSPIMHMIHHLNESFHLASVVWASSLNTTIHLISHSLPVLLSPKDLLPTPLESTLSEKSHLMEVLSCVYQHFCSPPWSSRGRHGWMRSVREKQWQERQKINVERKTRENNLMSWA